MSPGKKLSLYAVALFLIHVIGFVAVAFFHSFPPVMLVTLADGLIVPPFVNSLLAFVAQEKAKYRAGIYTVNTVCDRCGYSFTRSEGRETCPRCKYYHLRP